MSEEGYIQVACHECNERISLPLDGVGVAFNCPHCGVDLQMLLKHICEHCGGRLSFDGNPEAIGVQIECGHCRHMTALQPSTFVMDDGGAKTEPGGQEEYDEEEYDEEEYDEEEYDEEEYDEEPEVQVRRRTGPPKPRPPVRKGLPKRRPPKRAGSQEGQRPAKIGRTLAGAGAKPKEEQSSGGPRKRPRPKRKTRAQRSSVQPSSGPVSSGSPTRRIDGAPPESQEVDSMDPMSGGVPGGSSDAAGPAGPAGPGPVERRVAGASADGPQPTFKESSSEDEDEVVGPWYRNREKQTLVVVIFVFLFVFIPFGLPNFVKIFDLGLGNRIERIVKLKFLFTEGDYRSNPSDDIQVDQDSIKIQPIDENSSTTFVIGEALNTSSETLLEVELHFNLYDSNGEILGEAVEYKDEMGPNSTWNFRAPCLFTNVVRADLVKVIVR